MDRNGFGPHISDEGFIDRKSRTGVDDLIPWITIGLLAQANGRLCTWKDNDPLRRRFNSPGLAQMLCNGFSKGKDSLGITIMGIIEVNLSLDLFLNESRNRKIGFSQIAFDHLFPLIFDALI